MVVRTDGKTFCGWTGVRIELPKVRMRGAYEDTNAWGAFDLFTFIGGGGMVGGWELG